MMQKITILLLVIMFLSSSSSAETRYVSDDLYTYMHAGAGAKFKIIGSINSGEKIELIQTNRSAGFTQIKDSRGRYGWINSKYVSKHPGLKERLEKLEIQLTKLNTQLRTDKEKANKNITSLENNLKFHSSEVRELKNTNLSLNEELQQVQALNNNLNEKLDTEKNDQLMRWFSYGGMVAGISLILGLILPSLIPNRRKKSRWS